LRPIRTCCAVIVAAGRQAQLRAQGQVRSVGRPQDDALRRQLLGRVLALDLATRRPGLVPQRLDEAGL